MGWGVQVTARPTIEEPEHGHPDLHAAGQIVASSPREIFWRLFRRDRAAMASLVFLAIMILLAITAPLISSHIMHHGPNQLFITETLDQFALPTGPSKQFWFGPDAAARDLAVRVLYGARTSLIVAFFATGISVAIGVTVGLISGFYRG